MRGQAMAAGVVPASVTAYASSRSRFLGARLERARRRERVRACARSFAQRGHGAAEESVYVGNSRHQSSTRKNDIHAPTAYHMDGSPVCGVALN